MAQHREPTLRRLWHPTAVGCLLATSLACAAPSWAEPSAASTARPAGSAHAERVLEAPEWLQRIRQAALQRSYQGTLVVTGSGGVSSSRVAHVVQGGRRTERIDALAGEAHSLVRQEGVTRSVWPHKQMVIEETHDRQVLFPGLSEEADERVLSWYELRPVGTDRVAGHDALVLSLQARDPLRFSFRLWVERQSHLLLRLDTLDANGQTLESTAFSDLTLDVRPATARANDWPTAWRHYRVVRSVHQDTQLAQEGWALKTLPPGFRQVSCSRRTLTPGGSVHPHPVLQAMFSDGLAHVSLFVESGAPPGPAPESRHVLGATHMLRTLVEGHWVTVVGDVPPETLRRFVTALERKSR